jgi:type I restriction enzyme S subunit
MIDLSPAHTAIIKQILAKELPNHEVAVFGSRVTGTAKPYSDVDLAVISKDGLDKNKLWELREAFEESDLPFSVDVLDWNKLSEGFKIGIQNNCEKLV